MAQRTLPSGTCLAGRTVTSARPASMSSALRVTVTVMKTFFVSRRRSAAALDSGSLSSAMSSS